MKLHANYKLAVAEESSTLKAGPMARMAGLGHMAHIYLQATTQVCS